jgi:hypothetical protein
MQECNNSNKLNSLDKKIRIVSQRVDSVCTSEEIRESLEIEGLKSEKRMIQSTDRTILDVNRQAEIDRLLKKLEK